MVSCYIPFLALFSISNYESYFCSYTCALVGISPVISNQNIPSGKGSSPPLAFGKSCTNRKLR